MDSVKVQGHDGLRKNLMTQGVINCDESAFEQALALKKRRLDEIEKNKNLEKRVEQLESLVHQLLEGKQNGGN